MKKALALVVIAGFAAGTDAQFCSACKWGVNKVVSYMENYGNNAVCSAVLGEVQSYTMDACNSLDDCSEFITKMCNDVMQQVESDAGSALSADGIDATSICTDVGACGSSSSTSSGSDDASTSGGSDDDSWRQRARRSGGGWAQSFCNNECSNYPHPDECYPACVRQCTNGAASFSQVVNNKMREDARQNPTITLSSGHTGNCVRDSQSMQFVCSVDHPTSAATADQASSSHSSSSSSNLSTGATVGIIVGAVAAVLIIAGIAFKARSENEKVAAPTTSVLLADEGEEYATA